MIATRFYPNLALFTLPWEPLPIVYWSLYDDLKSWLDISVNNDFLIEDFVFILLQKIPINNNKYLILFIKNSFILKKWALERFSSNKKVSVNTFSKILEF